MAGKGDLAGYWSEHKDKAKKLAAADAKAKKAFESLSKKMNKNLGTLLDKVGKAVEAADRAAFDDAAEKAGKVIKDYRDAVEAAETEGILTKKMLEPLTFALSKTKEGGLPDQFTTIRKTIPAPGAQMRPVFTSSSPKLTRDWIEGSVTAFFKGTNHHKDLVQRMGTLESFSKGRASFYPADLQKLLDALSRFQGEMTAGNADEDSQKTYAKLRKLVEGQDSAVKAHEADQQKKAAARRKKVTDVTDALEKELRDVGKVLNKLLEKVNELDGDSRGAVEERDRLDKSILPRDQTARDQARAKVADMLSLAGRITAAMDGLGRKLPDISGVQALIDKTYEDQLDTPDDLEKLAKALERSRKIIQRSFDDMQSLHRDTVRRLGG